MKHTYRNIEFEEIKPNLWKFNSFLPHSSLRWAYWARFMTPEERKNTTMEAMKKAIDRAYDDNPVYRGDIRDLLE